MTDIKLIHAKDSVYAINNYLAINGLQRFNYRYTGREQDLFEIGNATIADTTKEPETSGSFEITDTGGLAAMMARMRFNPSTQKYMAGDTANSTSNAYTITHNDLEYMNFDLVEQKKPGGTFTEAKLFPNSFLTRFGVRLSADNVGSVSFDWSGNLMLPIYKPYHQIQSYPATRTTATTATLHADLAVNATTHNIIGGMVNNVVLAATDLTFATNVVTLTGPGQLKVPSFSATDRIMIFAFVRTPTNMVSLGYTNNIRFVRPDRIDLWLVPEATPITDTNRFLRVQSFDLNSEVPRDELKQILRNEDGTTTFTRHARFPLNFTGSFNVLEETLHKWAQLQGKTLDEAATATTVVPSNILDVSSWINSKIVARWYRYGSTSPIQEMTLAKVTITQVEGTQTAQNRKEQVWGWKSDGNFSLQGFDVA
jgi:hypothetical protein